MDKKKEVRWFTEAFWFFFKLGVDFFGKGNRRLLISYATLFMIIILPDRKLIEIAAKEKVLPIKELLLLYLKEIKANRSLLSVYAALFFALTICCWHFKRA